jgi:hypothetical protein
MSLTGWDNPILHWGVRAKQKSVLCVPTCMSHLSCPFPNWQILGLDKFEDNEELVVCIVISLSVPQRKKVNITSTCVSIHFWGIMDLYDNALLQGT